MISILIASMLFAPSSKDTTAQDSKKAMIVCYSEYNLEGKWRDTTMIGNEYDHIRRIVTDTIQLNPGKYKFRLPTGKKTYELEAGKFYIAELRMATGPFSHDSFHILSGRKLEAILNEPLFLEAIKQFDINESNFVN